MAENRYKKRHRKRISLNFGISKAEKFGFTDDIHHHGLFIRSAVCAKPGVTIKVEIKHESGLIALLGEVRWAKKSLPTFYTSSKAGWECKLYLSCPAKSFIMLCVMNLMKSGDHD